MPLTHSSSSFAVFVGPQNTKPKTINISGAASVLLTLHISNICEARQEIQTDDKRSTLGDGGRWTGGRSIREQQHSQSVIQSDGHRTTRRRGGGQRRSHRTDNQSGAPNLHILLRLMSSVCLFSHRMGWLGWQCFQGERDLDSRIESSRWNL